MKRICVIFSAAFLLCGCSDSQVLSESPAASSGAPESSYDPFYMPPLGRSDMIDANYGYGLMDPPDGMRLRCSDPLTLHFWLENSGDPIDYGILIYVNGVLQECSADGSEESQTLPRMEIDKNERREFSVTFSPKAAAGDAAFVLTYALMFHPAFAPESEICSFGNYYRLSGSSLLLTETGAIPLTEKAMTVTEAAPIPAEIAERFYERDDNGNVIGNPLLTGTQLLAERQSALEKADNALRPADSVKLTLLGGASERKWRISMYCDHELVRAFDGAEYLDMTASNKTMSVYTVPMSVLGERNQKYSSVYFIAAPLGADLSDDPLRSHVFVYVSK